MNLLDDKKRSLPDDFPESIQTAKRAPWGYYRSVEEENMAYPDWDALECLSKAFDMIDGGQSLREMEQWMKSQGHEITRPALTKLWHKWRPNSPMRLKNEEIKRQRKRSEAKALTKLQRREKEKARKKAAELAAAKRSLTNAKKRVEQALGEKIEQAQVLDEVKKISSETLVTPKLISPKEIEKERKVIFKPNDGPQTDFLASPELEVLYGGAAGGGKSYAMIADPMRYFGNRNFVGLLLRRTNDELRELIWKTKELYPEVFKGAKFSERKSEWEFPSGARLWMSYLDRDDDVLRYQGQAFTWIGFDELTQWPTPFPWDYLRSRLRTTDPELQSCLSMRATTNPGHLGHAWVKKMFIDPSEPGEAFWATSLETGEVLTDPETGEPLFKRKFIPAKLSDNPYLSLTPEYRRNLLSLPEAKRRQLLDGDWNLADGAAFPEFRRGTHVCEPFYIDEGWTRFRAADYGYGSFSAVLWFAINPTSEQLVVYRELYESKLTGKALAHKVMQLEQGERVSYGVLDSSVWHKRGEGPSVAEVMIQEGCRWRPSDRSAGSRTSGKDRIHELLKIDEYTEEPGLLLFNNCRQTIADLEVIPLDPNGKEDVDPRFRSDHTYDALRYGVMSRPRSNFFWDTHPEAATPPVQIADRVFGY